MVISAQTVAMKAQREKKYVLNALQYGEKVITSMGLKQKINNAISAETKEIDSGTKEINLETKDFQKW